MKYFNLLVLLLMFSCAKEEPTPDPVKYTLTVTAGEGGNVSSTGGSYPLGSEVTITATPNSEYVFSGWSNGSTDNPLVISLTENTVLTANFELITYQLDVNVQGSGTVIQSILRVNSDGTLVRLQAVPEECWQLSSWSDTSNGTETSIEILIGVSESKSIDVEFEEIPVRELPPFNQTSYESRTYYNRSFNQHLFNLQSWFNDPLDAVVVDYNGDGYLDFVHTNPNYGDSFTGVATRNKIVFYEGDCSGAVTLNEELSNKFSGLIHGRKGLVGDYNNDGYPDLFFAGAGIDTDPFPGEYPILLINNGGTDFIEHRFEDLIGFWHTATSGDYDNDGDLDIVLISQGITYLMINNGGEFEIVKDDVNWDSRAVIEYPRVPLVPELNQIYTSELYDINKDGFLDLIVSGHDFPDTYQGESAILYGNGSSFLEDKNVLPSVTGYGICIDIDFYDINNDGTEEIILNRTGDPNDGLGFYRGWKVQILELDGASYVDVTDTYMDISFGNESNWMYWLHISDYDNDGVVELFNDDLQTETSSYARPYREWELINGRFELQN